MICLACCREYADFRVSSDGEVQGVGLLIAADPNSGKLVVLAPIQGGPADRAGIKPGDEVASITRLNMQSDASVAEPPASANPAHTVVKIACVSDAETRAQPAKHPQERLHLGQIGSHV